MRGHEDLIALRKRHRVVSRGVLIEVTTNTATNTGLDNGIMDGSAAFISIRPDEPIDSLDLRCLVGLKVLVFAYYWEPLGTAVRKVCMAAVDGGAKRVQGVQAMQSIPVDGLPPENILFDYTRPQQ